MSVLPKDGLGRRVPARNTAISEAHHSDMITTPGKAKDKYCNMPGIETIDCFIVPNNVVDKCVDKGSLRFPESVSKI